MEMLSCCMDSCEFKNLTSDQNVQCWLCDRYAHFKCAGISERDLKNGLKWSCKDCRLIKSQMGTFIRQTRMEINELFREFRVIHDKCLQLESAFASLKMLCDPAFKSEPPGNTNSSDEDYCTIVENNISEGEPKTAEIWDLDRHIPAILPVHSVRKKPSTALPLPEILTAVPPMKAVFVSRLIPSTTEDALKHYVVTKLSYPYPDEIHIRKIYNKQKRKISSFKILLPDPLFSQILNPGFWPEHIVVHEFIKKNESTGFDVKNV
ncbi:uncharacterized protein LOC128252721 [Drosophila gunungcola]|uniref:uncharacterized protein LOC128252721 n=1 Tax=Drosophila gunungcola TaxID=103775 RepID=UPI0022E8CD4B|nr:uncharacterized protein LOC128252721 [Drosophila gunungcola]